MRGGGTTLKTASLFDRFGYMFSEPTRRSGWCPDFPFRVPGFETVGVQSGAPFRRFQVVLPVEFM
jgi:hypothetical protein